MHAIALTMVPQIGSIQSRILLEQLGSARAIFHTPRSRLEKIAGIGPVRARAITTFRDHRKAEKECRTMERLRIRPLLFNDPDYPARLTHVPDPPPILFYRGNADLNSQKVIAVVGTRRETEYGRMVIDAFVDAWKGQGLLVVSGLAYGVDHHTHQGCVQQGIQNIGVLAHGLDKIYPPSHHALAMQLERCGGLLTEFLTGTQPDRQNFPRRNRIVAGLCDAVLVIETDIKGGSMITADLANGYHREVFAVPGRIGDEKSQGCNFLIRENRARLSMHPMDIMTAMNWDPVVREPSAPPELHQLEDPDQQQLLKQFRPGDVLHVDQLHALSALPHSRFSAALLALELQGKLTGLPGNRYKLSLAEGQNLLRI